MSAGYGFRSSGSTFTDATYGTVTASGTKGGFLGGVQAGYSYQLTPGSGLVLGVETDLQGVGFGKSAAGTIGTTPYYSVAPSLDYFGTVRGRIGYAFDRLLVYGPGGFAYDGGSASSYASAYPYTLPDTIRLGYAVGGVEYALAEKISARSRRSTSTSASAGPASPPTTRPCPPITAPGGARTASASCARA